MSLIVYETSDSEKWSRAEFPDGSSIGHYEAQVLKRIATYGPILPSELKDLIKEFPVSKYLIRNLTNKGLVKARGRINKSRERSLEATTVGHIIFHHLYNKGLLGEVKKNESS